MTISGIVYHLSFVWSKAKAGIPGKDGVDADMLDWVKELSLIHIYIDCATSPSFMPLARKNISTLPEPGC